MIVQGVNRVRSRRRFYIYIYIYITSPLYETVRPINDHFFIYFYFYRVVWSIGNVEAYFLKIQKVLQAYVSHLFYTQAQIFLGELFLE